MPTVTVATHFQTINLPHGVVTEECSRAEQRWRWNGRRLQSKNPKLGRSLAVWVAVQNKNPLFFGQVHWCRIRTLKTNKKMKQTTTSPLPLVQKKKPGFFRTQFKEESHLYWPKKKKRGVTFFNGIILWVNSIFIHFYNYCYIYMLYYSLIKKMLYYSTRKLCPV